MMTSSYKRDEVSLQGFNISFWLSYGQKVPSSIKLLNRRQQIVPSVIVLPLFKTEAQASFLWILQVKLRPDTTHDVLFDLPK